MPSKTTPDAVTQYRRLDLMVGAAKKWPSGVPIPWVSGNGIPAGFKAEQPLIYQGLYPASLKVMAYYKQSRISGVAAKLSLSLCYQGVRIYGLDENGVCLHRNDIGVGRPMFGHRIGFPHEHTLSPEPALVGYAEEIPRQPLGDLWARFVSTCGISDAPDFELPPGQLEFSL